MIWYVLYLFFKYSYYALNIFTYVVYQYFDLLYSVFDVYQAYSSTMITPIE